MVLKRTVELDEPTTMWSTGDGGIGHVLGCEVNGRCSTTNNLDAELMIMMNHAVSMKGIFVARPPLFEQRLMDRDRS